MGRSLSVFVFITALSLSPTAVHAVEWHVNAEGTGDVPTIQAAFDAASPGDVILLAPGTYRDSHTREVTELDGTVSTTTAVAFMSSNVSLTGAGAGASILDGEELHHCLVGQDLGVPEITGITLLDGRTTGSGGLAGKGGAGVLIFRSGPVIEECEFRSCGAPEAGDGASGLYLVGGGQGRVRFNLFVDNSGGGIGGAVGILQVSCCCVDNNTFVRNEAGDGGGAIEINASVVLLRGNIFAFNSAAVRSGAVLCLNDPAVTAACNLFWENTAPVDEHVTNGCVVIGELQNIVADPLFCDPVVDDFSVHEDSPAAPDHPSGCGARGAYPVGCGTVSVERESWATVKARYR